MRQFEITLKNEKLKLYDRISWLIVFIHIVIFLYLGLFSKDKHIAAGYKASLILLAAAFILRYYLQYRKSRWQIKVEGFFWLLMIVWIVNQQYWLAIIPGVFFCLSLLTFRKFIVTFSEDKIFYPSIPLKIIYWKELNNTIMKDGLLTIDFRNNKIIQQVIDENRTAINEKEFNEFCSQQLRSAAGI